MNNDPNQTFNQQSQSPSNSAKSATGKNLQMKKQSSVNYSQFKQNSLSQQVSNQNNNDKGGWAEVEKTKFMLEDVIEDLDKKLNKVLAKQEYEYLKGYNIYVKRKEKELRELIQKLNEKNSNNTFKDEKIYNLEKTINAIRDDQIKQEKEKEQLAEKVKYWKTKALGYEQEKDFLQQQIMDAKKQNKLLKLAIGRLQNDLEQKEEVNKSQIINNESNTFLTEAQQIEIKNEKQSYIRKGEYQVGEGYINVEVSQLIDGTTAQTSLLDAGISKVSVDQRKKLHQRRVMTRSPTSRYRYIPTDNIKFQKFLDLIFQTKMSKDDIKEEIHKYVQALETNYNDVIRELKSQADREKNKIRKVLADKSNEFSEKNELESLFVDCIEEVRKDIMKRRLKNEIYNKKKFQQIEKNSEEAKEFEDSLLKLAQLAKSRIKMEDFTIRDKCNLLDLFVNNEKTLLKIYETLFPHRSTNQTGIINTVSSKDKHLTSKNSLLQMSLNPYLSQNDTVADSKIDQKFPQIFPNVKNDQNQTMVEFGSIRQSQAINTSFNGVKNNVK